MGISCFNPFVLAPFCFVEFPLLCNLSRVYRCKRIQNRVHLLCQERTFILQSIVCPWMRPKSLVEGSKGFLFLHSLHLSTFAQYLAA